MHGRICGENGARTIGRRERDNIIVGPWSIAGPRPDVGGTERDARVLPASGHKKSQPTRWGGWD